MTARLRPAGEADIGAIHALMLELAEYEKLTQMFIATEDDLRDALFGPHPAVECLVAQWSEESKPDDSAAVSSPMHCFFIITQPSSAGAACIWKTCMCSPANAAVA